jgi:hypothetical protein
VACVFEQNGDGAIVVIIIIIIISSSSSSSSSTISSSEVDSFGPSCMQLLVKHSLIKFSRIRRGG